jgi:hypothetical protein
MALLFYFGDAPDSAHAQAPMISNVTASDVSDSGATITWTTDIGSTSQVEYGINSYDSITDVDNQLVTAHSVVLGGNGDILPSTTYHYRVRSSANGAEAISEDHTFTTTESGCGKAYDITITSITPSTVAVNTSVLLTVHFTSTDPYQYDKDQIRLVWDPQNTSATDRRAGLLAQNVSGSGTQWSLTFMSGPLSQADQRIFVSLSIQYPPCQGNPQSVDSNVYDQLQAVNAPPVLSTVSIRAIVPNASEPGSAGKFRVTRTSTSGALSVNYAVNLESTAKPSDYTLAPGSPLKMADGVADADILVTPIDDKDPEPNETVIVELQPGTGYTVASAPANRAVVTIADDDKPSTGGLTFFVPIVLSVQGQNNSFFSTEMTMTNRSARDADFEFEYTANFGVGSGVAPRHAKVSAGRQIIIEDTIQYLRSDLGLVGIPASGDRGGTLRVRVTGPDVSNEVNISLRTTTLTPTGRAGLAYSAIPMDSGLDGAAYLFGLRQDARDRSNVAIQNMGDTNGSIRVELTIFSANGTLGPFVKTSEDLPAGGFTQFSGILGDYGITEGYVKVRKLSGTAHYYAYGVVNDQATSDGSFIEPVPEGDGLGGTGATVPVIVETARFSSELIMANQTSSAKSLSFLFRADAIQNQDKTFRFTLDVPAGVQYIYHEIVNMLRNRNAAGASALPPGKNYSGALIMTTNDMEGVFVGARTSAEGDGGRYGLSYPGVLFGRSLETSGWVYGLQQNSTNRSNLALVTGNSTNTPNTYSIDIYDGDGTTGSPVKVLDGISGQPAEWKQFDSILAVNAPGTRQGYARVRRTSGSNPFVLYSVINDGAAPGQRTGDGAFLLGSRD